MKLTATVSVVAGLVALSVILAMKFLGSAPVVNDRAALRYTDNDRSKVTEIRQEPNPDVIPDRNSQGVNNPLPATESSPRQSESLDYIAGFQAGREAGLRGAKQAEAELVVKLRAAAELRVADELRAAAELQAAKKRFMEFDRSDYHIYDMDTLRSLADGMDSKAQVALAMKLLPPNPGANDGTKAEALELVMAASESGEPMAAVLAADLLSQQNEPVRGYSYLVRFEQKHGEDALVRGYIDNYPSIHRTSAQELNRRVQWYLDNPTKSGLKSRQGVSDLYLAPDYFPTN